MKKPLPQLKTDEEAERFVAEADLTEYDLSGMRPIHFEFQPKSERVNMRLPRLLLEAVRASASRAGVPYQRFIRQALEDAVQRKRGRRFATIRVCRRRHAIERLRKQLSDRRSAR